MSRYYLHKKPSVLDKIKKSSRFILGLVLFSGASYLLLLTQAPNINLFPARSVSAESVKVSSEFNSIKINKIGVDIRYFEGDYSVLNQGAWHRFPERGNPKDGGNFILSAHRFKLGLTPWGTKARSPFYNLHKLDVGDDVTVIYEEKTYNYKITKKYDVERTATEIEAPSAEAKLTLYSCALGGEKDGRIVVEAQLAN